MCDYSLETLQNRPAKVGEQLQSSNFGVVNGSVGMASADSPSVAVCLCEGTKVMLRDVPETMQRAIGILESEIPAVFAQRQRPLGHATSYRDGFKFENGTFILLQNLPESFLADVLSIPGQPAMALPDGSVEEELESVPVGVLSRVEVSTLVAGVSACWILAIVASALVT